MSRLDHCRTTIVVALLIGSMWPQSLLAQSFLPAKGAAPGSDTASASPFAGIASQPGTDSFTGAANTSISIAVPPGRAQMTPKVNLSYSSTGGRGPFGYGWGMSAGRILRSTKYGVPAYDNSIDEFVLELPGTVIEIVKMAGSTTRYAAKHEGSFLAIGFDQTRNYWKVIDRDGTLFVFGRDPATYNSTSGPNPANASTTYQWLLEIVMDNVGNYIEYSYEPRLPTAPSGRLSKIRYGGTADRKRWETHGLTGRRTLPNLFEVAFEWTDNGTPDPPQISYAAGFPEVVGDRWTLTHITTSYLPDQQSGWQQIRDYSFLYEEDPATYIRRLGLAFMVAANELGYVTPPASVFQYAPSLQLGWPIGPQNEREVHAVRFQSPGPLRDNHGSSASFDTFDINGDGLVDYVTPGSVRLGTGSGFEIATPWPWPSRFSLQIIRSSTTAQNYSRDIFDLNGDSLPDFVNANATDCHQCLGAAWNTAECWGSEAFAWVEQRPADCWDVYLNNGQGFEQSPIYWPAIQDFVRDHESSSSGQTVDRDTIDLNGDGLPDFVVAHVNNGPEPQNSPHWWVYWNTGNGFLQDPENWAAPIEYDRISTIRRVPQSEPVYQTRWGLVDMNGDGLPDLLDARNPDSPTSNTTSYWRVYFNNGSGFESQPLQWRVENVTSMATHYTISDAKKAGRRQWDRGWKDLVDVTGDGLPDLVRKGNDDPSRACIPWSDRVCSMNNGATPPPECCIDARVLVNTGSSFSQGVAVPAWGASYASWASPRWSAQLRGVSQKGPNSSDREFDLLDFDGDGLIDLLELIGDEWHLYRNPAHPDSDWPVLPTDLQGASGSFPIRTRPNLMVGMMNGLGAVTLLEYRPASLIIDAPCTYVAGQPQSGRCIPFPYWVVTTRTIDDPASTLPPLETTHVYAGGLYLGAAKDFRGFREVWTTDQSGQSSVQFFHQDASRRGNLEYEYKLGDPGCNETDPIEDCDPWDYTLLATHYEWDVDPVLLRRVTVTPYTRYDHGNVPLSELEKVTDYEYSAYGLETRKRVSAHGQSYEVHTEYTEKTSSGFPRRYIVSKPSRVSSIDNGQLVSEATMKYHKRYWYPKRQYNCVSFNADRTGCVSWLRVSTKFDKTHKMMRERRGPTREKTRYYYDKHQLYIAATESAKTGLSTETDHDMRTGHVVRSVDTSGVETHTVYDALGRPVMVLGYEPEVDPITGARVIFEEQFYAYVEPDPISATPGYTYSKQEGSSPSISFYDGLQRELASKVYVDATTNGTRTVVSGLRQYNLKGQVTSEAAPFDITDVDTDFFALNTTFADSPADERTSYEYDPHTGHRTRQILPGGQVTQYIESIPGMRVSIDANLSAGGVDPGTAFVESIDAFGRKISATRCSALPTVTAAAANAPSFVYALGGYWVCPPGQTTSRSHYSYDALDRLTKLEIFDFDQAGPLQSQTIRTIKYNGLGKEVEVTEANSGTTTFSYDRYGLLAGVTDPRGLTTQYRYDDAGRTISEVHGYRSPAEIRIDYRHYPSSSSTAVGSRGKLQRISVHSPGSDIVRDLQYNLRGQIVQEIVTMSTTVEGITYTTAYTSHEKFDRTGRLIEASYPSRGPSGANLDETKTYTYSPYGAPLAGGGVVDAEYDIYGNLVRVDYASGFRDLYAYEPMSRNGHLKCIRSTPTGDTSACVAIGSPADALAIEYPYADRDSVGRIKRVADKLRDPALEASDHQRVAYDAMGRVTWVEHGGGGSETFEYSSLGNMTRRNGVAYSYASAQGMPHRPLSFGSITFNHDDGGNRIQKGNTRYYYDPLGRLIRVEDSAPGGTDLLVNFYGTGAERVARYDVSEDSLTHYFGGKFEYNITSGELIRHFYFGGIRVSSDRLAAPNDLITSITASASLLTPATGNAGAASRALATVRTEFSRTQAAATAQIAAAASVVAITLAVLLLVYLGSGLSGNTPQRRVAALVAAGYLIAVVPLPALPLGGLLSGRPCVGPKLAHAQSLGQVVYYHRDQTGSPRAISDGTGQVVELLRYMAYGELRGVFDRFGTPKPATTTRISFGGHESDRASGLIDFGARFYDPEIGLFLTPDPAKQFASPYTYSGFDPINGTDPDGRFGLEALAAIIPLLVGAATFVQTWAKTGDFGAALTAGIIAGVVSFYVAGIASNVVIPVFHLEPLVNHPMFQLAATVNTGAGGVSSFQRGDIAGGLASVLNLASGLGTALQQPPATGVANVAGGDGIGGAQPRGEWMFAEGASQDLNDYRTVITNGVGTNQEDFARILNAYRGRAAGFYNPTAGVPQDLFESAGQIIDPADDQLAQDFATDLAKIDHPVRIIAHSQGTLTAANAAAMGAVPRGSTIILKSPVVGLSRAQTAAAVSGAKLVYDLPLIDVSRAIVQPYNPLGLTSGVIDALSGFRFHKGNGLCEGVCQ